MEQTNPAGGNPATSTQNAITNPPGSNAPATKTRAFNSPGTGATINTPRGQVDVGANANGGLNVDVNRNAAGTANAEMRQDLREDRQNSRQDLRAQRQDQRQENRLERQNDPNRWRYSYQNGEWWYWQPDNSWMYWRNNQWMPYNAGTYLPNAYTTGYRGAANGNSPTYYYDENGLRYRRDYSPAQPQNSEMQTGVQSQSSATQSGMQPSSGSGGASSRMNENLPNNYNETNEGGTGQSSGANSGAEIGGAAGSTPVNCATNNSFILTAFAPRVARAVFLRACRPAGGAASKPRVATLGHFGNREFGCARKNRANRRHSRGNLKANELQAATSPLCRSTAPQSAPARTNLRT